MFELIAEVINPVEMSGTAVTKEDNFIQSIWVSKLSADNLDLELGAEVHLFLSCFTYVIVTKALMPQFMDMTRLLLLLISKSSFLANDEPFRIKTATPPVEWV